MDSTFGKSFLFLTKLAWNCKVTLPVLVTAVFLAMDFRMQIELNIETEQLVFQDDVDDSDEYETVEESDDEDSDTDNDADIPLRGEGEVNANLHVEEEEENVENHRNGTAYIMQMNIFNHDPTD